MPKTRASTRRRVSKRKPREEIAISSDNDFSYHSHGDQDVEAEPETSIMDDLKSAMSSLKRAHSRCQSLGRENKRLKTELKEARENVLVDNRRTRLGSRENTSRRRVQSLERKVVALEAAREKDRLTIKKLRDTEVEQEAQELTANQDDDAARAQTGDLGDSAIKLLRRMCDTIDMNTLAEAEECAICMEEMAVGECYGLPCRHPVCVGCFEQLGDGSNIPSNDRTAVQCPHCRQIYPRKDREIITHTAVQQWDILLEISQQWAAKDIGELDVEEDENEENSFIDDDSVVAVESPHPPDSPKEVVILDPGTSTASTSPSDNGPVAYNNLSSPMKRKLLRELAERRAVKQRV